MQKICCCHDLCTAKNIEVSGRFGYFDLEFLLIDQYFLFLENLEERQTTLFDFLKLSNC